MIHPDIIHRVVLDLYDVPQADLWVLMARAQVSESVSWLSGWLWRLRACSWMTSPAVGEHCQACGCRLSPGLTSRAKFCSTACRVRSHRSSKDSGFTPLGASVESHRSELRQLEKELDVLRRWYARNRSMQVVPPDLLKVQHLPRLPGRCGSGCGRGSGCSHTDGSVCLFAATRGERVDE